MFVCMYVWVGGCVFVWVVVVVGTYVEERWRVAVWCW